MSASTCPRCNESLPRSARFCRRCGHKANVARRRVLDIAAWTLIAALFGVRFWAGAVSSSISALRERENGLLGKWVELPPSGLEDGSARRLSLWCRPDGTFGESCDVLDLASNHAVRTAELSGTWRVNGDTLTCEVSQATRPDMSPLGSWRYRVASLHADELVLRIEQAPTALPDREQDRIIRFRRDP